MSGVGLEILLEGLVPEIAYSGEKGSSSHRRLDIFALLSVLQHLPITISDAMNTVIVFLGIFRVYCPGICWVLC